MIEKAYSLHMVVSHEEARNLLAWSKDQEPLPSIVVGLVEVLKVRVALTMMETTHE